MVFWKIMAQHGFFIYILSKYNSKSPYFLRVSIIFLLFLVIYIYLLSLTTEEEKKLNFM